MKKIFILLVIISSAFIGKAQQTKTITIQWEDNSNLPQKSISKNTGFRKKCHKEH